MPCNTRLQKEFIVLLVFIMQVRAKAETVYSMQQRITMQRRPNAPGASVKSFDTAVVSVGDLPQNKSAFQE